MEKADVSRSKTKSKRPGSWCVIVQQEEKAGVSRSKTKSKRPGSWCVIVQQEEKADVSRSKTRGKSTGYWSVMTHLACYVSLYIINILTTMTAGTCIISILRQINIIH